MKMSAKINRMTDKPGSSIKAFATVNIDGCYAVHGIRVCESERGRFVSMPSVQYTDHEGNKQYQDIFHPISKEAREALVQTVLNAYECALSQNQTTEINPQPSCQM